MENLPFDLIGLDAGEVQALENVYNALKVNFTITIPDDLPELDVFEVFKCYRDISIGGVLQVGNCTLVFVKMHYVYHNTKGVQHHDVYRYQVWARADLNRDFGRVIIRRETFADKVIEIIHPVELDFADDKAFSDKFYVVTNDKFKAQLAMDSNFRKAVMEMKDEEVIELEKNRMIIFNNYGIENPQHVVHLAIFASKLASRR